MHAGAKRKRWHIRPHAINGAIETKSRPPLAGDALDKAAPMRCAKPSAARQRPQPDEEICGGEVSWRSLPGVKNTYIGRCLYSSTQGTAALRDFDPVYVADGSWSCENTLKRGLRRRDVSGMATIGALAAVRAFSFRKSS
jgi:hypothetical protein